MLISSVDLAKLIILLKIKVNIGNSYDTHQLLNKRDDEKHSIVFQIFILKQISITKAKIPVCNMQITGK